MKLRKADNLLTMCTVTKTNDCYPLPPTSIFLYSNTVNSFSETLAKENTTAIDIHDEVSHLNRNSFLFLMC